MNTRKLLPILALTTCLVPALPAHAEIYKWRDAEGNIHFSDEAPADGAEKLQLKPLPTMNFPMPERIEVDNGKPELYEVLAITKPANDARLRDVDGRINVSASLEPDLKKGHRLQIWIDGEEAAPPDTNTSLVAENVPGGEHRLKVVVLDKKGKPLQSSAEVRFFLLQDTSDQ